MAVWFCPHDHMLDATQHHGLVWGGGVMMMMFCAPENYATSWVGVGWGGDDDVLCT